MRVPSNCLPEKRTISSYHCPTPRAIILALARQAGERSWVRLVAVVRYNWLLACSQSSPMSRRLTSRRTTSMAQEVMLQTNLPLPLFGRGKVRDTYDLGDRLLMVATDRISAFDAIMPDGIPDKGRVLTLLSAFWFGRTREIIPNHLISVEMTDLPESLGAAAEALSGRFMLVRKAKRLDFECVVRGYLAGSGWADYQRAGAVCGVKLPTGLRQADELPEPIFTPATKAESGHDINISLDEMKNSVGEDLGQAIADVSIA